MTPRPVALAVCHSNKTITVFYPVDYASHTLSAAERNFSLVEKEALAGIFCVTKMHQYLFCRHFEFVTDHKPLQCLFNECEGTNPLASARFQHWAEKLAAYNYFLRV